MTKLSCGHYADDDEEDGVAVTIKSETRDCQPAVDYMRVCKKCYDYYRISNLILHNEKQRFEYLRKKNDESH